MEMRVSKPNQEIDGPAVSRIAVLKYNAKHLTVESYTVIYAANSYTYYY